MFAVKGSLKHFAEAEHDADEFEVLLNSMGLEIRPGGALEALSLVLTELKKLHAGELSARQGTDLRSKFRQLVGLTHIVSLALATQQADRKAFKAHFELLNTGNPLQNQAAPPNDPSANKTLELLVGLALRHACGPVELDDPNVPGGDNPDVLLDYDGATWGLACKAIGGDAPATLFDRINDGVTQIENSRATRGIVVLSYKDRLPHDEAFPSLGLDAEGDPLLGTHRDREMLVLELEAFVRKRLQAMVEHATVPKIQELFQRKKSLPGVALVCQTTAAVRLPAEVAPAGLAGAPVVTRIGFLQVLPLEFTALVVPSAFDARAWFFLSKLNEGLAI
jgi:hypothetical protein